MSELGGTLGDQAEFVLINIKQPGLYPWGKRERQRGAADIDKESKQDLHYRYLPRCRSPTWPSGNCSLCRRCFIGDLVCSAPEVLQIPGCIGISPSRPDVSVNSPRRGCWPASGLSGSARGVRLGGPKSPHLWQLLPSSGRRASGSHAVRIWDRGGFRSRGGVSRRTQNLLRTQKSTSEEQVSGDSWRAARREAQGPRTSYREVRTASLTSSGTRTPCPCLGVQGDLAPGIWGSALR